MDDTFQTQLFITFIGQLNVSSIVLFNLFVNNQTETSLHFPVIGSLDISSLIILIIILTQKHVLEICDLEVY